jgi:hypothetical protein
MRVYFLKITKKNEVSYSATLRNIGSPWLKHIHVTDVSMCSEEINFFVHEMSSVVLYEP